MAEPYSTPDFADRPPEDDVEESTAPVDFLSAGEESGDLVPDEATAEIDQALPGNVPPRVRFLDWAFRFVKVDALFTLLLLATLIVGAWLRFDHQNWDDFTHLHPDERFMTDVVSSIGGPLQPSDSTQAERDAHLARCQARYPSSTNADVLGTLSAGIGPYFDAECSTLNPNNIGKGLYVYGEFPLFTVHAAGVARSQFSRDYHALLEAFDPDAAEDHVITTYWEGYSGAQFIGRSVSALADTLTILVLFLLGRRLYSRWAGLLAAMLYAFAAFPIQQSHFWTVDAFATFWVTLSIYLAVRAMDGASTQQGPRVLVYLAIWFGGVVWDTGYNHRPVMGLVTLGAIFLVTLAITAVIRLIWDARRETGGDLWIAASGIFATIIYLFGWTLVDVFAPHDLRIGGGLITVGLVSLMFALAAAITFSAAGIVRRHSLGLERSAHHTTVVGAVGITILALIAAYAIGGLAPWAVLFVALAAVALLIFDVTDLTDYALFGAALGGAVASRINIAPLAGIIVVAAGIRMLPALDRSLGSAQRSRLVMVALAGMMAAGFMSFVAFRLLQPHAFLGPHLIDLDFKFNPGWRDDASEAAYMTSGEWDAPPNHQWASRTPYLFPWRNIVEWGFGIPLGLASWAAWAWAGVTILRGRKNWTRHAIPFVWVLVCFGWLGGRWVTTMRYFLPIYPMLALFAAWMLWAAILGARRIGQSVGGAIHELPLQADLAGRGVLQYAPTKRGSFSRLRRVAYPAAILLLIVVLGYTVLYGVAYHNVQRRQLTRVAASRWFQETIPGDIGLWVEGDDGARQLINIGRSYVAPAPVVYRVEQDQTVELPFSVPANANLTRITLNRVFDPLRDPEAEVVRVRIFLNDAALGRQLQYEGTLDADLTPTSSPYGGQMALVPAAPVSLVPLADPTLSPNYILQITALDGGPVSFVHGVTDAGGMVLNDVSVGMQITLDQTLTFVDLNLPDQPILTGHGDDVPGALTNWTVGGSDVISFTIPIDGVIRELDIPHLGDPLRDAGQEAIRLTLIGPDGTSTTAMIQDDLNQGADPLGQPRTVIFDPPLVVNRYNAAGDVQSGTLMVEALDPVYTSGPVIAWEGDWDDPVPWPVCPLPDDMTYRDDLPSGLSEFTCNSVDMYGAHYQGMKLWMVAEDNDEKYHAMTNALDQADYIVITSNRFYDSLSRIPARWPMTLEYYKALFDGRLGFELVRTFESAPSVGPFRISDQVLPPKIPPDLLNEQWESEEAFSVYDHPVVLVYRKTEAYTSENMRAILNSVSRRSVRAASTSYTDDPEPANLVTWGAKQASKSPTLLQFTEEQWKIQRDGGTWRDLFDLDSLINKSQVVAVIAWWLLMILAGWAIWPLLYAIFPALPDRAYPAAKIAAWVVVAWIAWLGGTFHVLTWTRPGLLAILIGLAVFSTLIMLRQRSGFWRYVRANRRHLLALEGLSLALFLGFLGVRQTNPDLWHGSFGGEKPMDFAYFNAVLRSTIFPPIDPWFAKGYINYYYFGYVIVGAPVKLLGVRPALAYNLIIPTLYSMTGIGVFSIAYNWVRARAVRPGQIDGATEDVPHSSSDSVGEDDPQDSVGAQLAVPADQNADGERAGLALPLQGDEDSNESVGAYRNTPLQGEHDPDVSVEAIHELTLQNGDESAVSVGAYRNTPLQDEYNPDVSGGVYGNVPPDISESASPPRHRMEKGAGGEVEARLPAGNAWMAGFLAMLLAVVLGNLGTLYVIFDGIAYVGGWERPDLYHQVRLQEAEADRAAIYQDYYDEALKDFRSDHGRDPSDLETSEIALDAQVRTNDAIKDYADHPPIYKLWNYELGNLRRQVSAFFKGVPEVLSGKPLQSSPTGGALAANRWYWGPTRIIGELPNGAGQNAIAEMPYFTFLYGDLHAHMIAFPVTLLVLLWLLAEIMGAGHHLRRWWEAGLATALGAVAVGILRPTNSWDWITYLLLGVAALTYVAWVSAIRTRHERPEMDLADEMARVLRPRRIRQLLIVLAFAPLGMLARVGYYLVQQQLAEQQKLRGLKAGEEWIHPSLTVSGALAWAVAAVVLAGVLYVALLILLRARFNKTLLLAWMGRVGLFLALTFVAAVPFTMYFVTAYTSVKPWEQDTTPLWAYLYVHGTFIFIVISYLIWQTARWLRRVRVRDLEGQAVPVTVIGLGMAAVVVGFIVFGVREAAVAELAGPLIAWAALLFFLPRQHPLQRATFAIIVLALAISLGVELVVLDGDIGRQNTVFKFYLQVWFMLSIVGGVALSWMFTSAARWSHLLSGLWQGGLAILFSIALFYPVLATQGRAMDRFNRKDTPITLDGSEYMKVAIHGEAGVWFRLDGDYDMIRWFQENVEGTPVIVEAHQYPSEYHWNGRISINTGLPTLLGWRWHQLQQRSLPDMDVLVQNHENNVAAFYNLTGSEGIAAAEKLIRFYGVEYIVVGALERAFYGDIQIDSATNKQTPGHSEGLAKFDTMVEMGLLEIAYQHPRCLDTGITVIEECPAGSVYMDKIYHVVPGIEYTGAVSSGE